jgi:hypothetical protein
METSLGCKYLLDHVRPVDWRPHYRRISNSIGDVQNRRRSEEKVRHHRSENSWGGYPSKACQSRYEQRGVGALEWKPCRRADTKQVRGRAAKPLNSCAVVGHRNPVTRRSNSYASLSGLRSLSRGPGADVLSGREALLYRLSGRCVHGGHSGILL